MTYRMLRSVAVLLATSLVAGCATMYQATPEKKAIALAQSCEQMSSADRALFPECGTAPASKSMKPRSASVGRPPTSVVPVVSTAQAASGGEQQVAWPTSTRGPDPGKRPISDLGFAPNKSAWGVACVVMMRDAPSNARLPSDFCGRFLATSFGLDPLDPAIVCKDNVEIQNGSVVDGQIYQGDRKVPRLETNRVYQFRANVPLKDRLAKVCYLGMWRGLHLTVHQPYKCTNYSYNLSREKVWVATDTCPTSRRIGINLVSFSKLSGAMQNNKQFVSALQGKDTKTVSTTFGKALHMEAKNGAFAQGSHRVRFTLLRGSETVSLGTLASVAGQVFIDIDQAYEGYALKMEVDGQWTEVCNTWLSCKKAGGCVPTGTRYYTAVLR